MYKIPEDIDTTFLLGEEVIMVCFNLNQVYIHFESNIQVAIEGEYSIVAADGKESLFEVYPVISDNGLLRLLGRKVKQVKICEFRTDLSIQFDNDTVINLIGSDSYECYSIKINERWIIV